MPASNQSLVLPDDDCAELVRRVTASTSEVRVMVRALIILAYAETCSATGVAAQVACSKNTVRKWLGRYLEHGLGGLVDRPRSGTPPTWGDDARFALIAAATSAPPGPFTCWTYQRLADHLADLGFGVSRHWVSSTLAANDLDVPRVQRWLFRRGNPTVFAERAANICDLLINGPGDRGVIVSVDEKTSIQAPSKIHAVRLPAPGFLARTEFEYRRHGVTHLQAGWRQDTGGTFHRFCASNNSAEFIVFLEKIASQIPGRNIHLVLDNGSSHTSKQTREWLDLNPRFVTHFTPPHASWLNPVEQLFAHLTRQTLRHRDVRSVVDLEALITGWFTRRPNKPINWTWAYPEP